MICNKSKWSTVFDGLYAVDSLDVLRYMKNQNKRTRIIRFPKNLQKQNVALHIASVSVHSGVYSGV